MRFANLGHGVGALLLALAMAQPAIARADILTQQAKLTGLGDARGDEDERLGSAVAADGDTVVGGAPGQDLPDRDRGAAYVFVHADGVWTLQAKLGPANSATITKFGASVAVSGDTVVVGSGQFDAKVYVFVRTGGVWAEEAQITGSDTQPSDGFGAAVSISGDTVVVGAPGATTGFGSRSGACYVFLRSGDTWAEQQKLLPADLAADDSFGQSVAVSGDSLVAGSPEDDNGFGIDAGSAYVFVRTGSVWAQESKLAAPGTAPEGDVFGSSVSIDVDALAVGAPGEDASPFDHAGAVHVFRRATGIWSHEQRLVAAPPGSSSEFGAAVTLDADTLVAGAPRESTAHVFVRTGGTWSEQAELTESVPQFAALLGSSVAVSGDAAFAGAPGRDDSSGSAFVFRRAGMIWTQETLLDPPGTASFDVFGSAVDVEGDVLVVGTPSDDLPEGRDAGSVYVFVRTGVTWSLQQKIVASDANENDRFGTAVALSGDTLAVGVPEIEAAYVFIRVGAVWQEQQKLEPPGGALFQDFGSAVSLDGDSLIVGDPGEDEGATDAGAAYVFVRSGASWSLQQKLSSVAPENFAEAGSAVAIEGDTALVGVPRAGAGRVLVFGRAAGQWTEQQTLSASDGSSNDRFGQALALSGDSAIVGAPDADLPESFGAGAAYVFGRSGGPWVEEQKLVCAEPGALEALGSAVALSGDSALAGSDTPFSQPGSALLFERAGGSWTERQRIAAFDGAPNDRFGAAVALSGATAAVGAPRATTSSGFESGAAYVLVPATADLAVSITGSPGSVVQGELVTYTIVVSNSGPDAAPAVGVVSAVDPGLIVESASASQGACTHDASGASCAVGVVPTGASATVTLVAAAIDVGVRTSQASIAWGGSDPNAGNDTASASIFVDPGGPADVSVTKTTLSSHAALGANLLYRIDVTNLGPATAAGVVVQDPTPPGLTLLNSSSECSDSFPCTISRIPLGEARAIFALFSVPVSYPGPDPVVNTASLTTATPDPVSSNDTSTVETPFFIPAHDLDFYTLTPCRLLDTRDPEQGGPEPLAAGSVQTFSAISSCGVPFGAKAVALNATVTQALAPGHLSLYPAGLPVPATSTVNYGAGQTRGSNAVVSLSEGGALAVGVGQASGTVHVIIDVFGYFQ